MEQESEFSHFSSRVCCTYMKIPALEAGTSTKQNKKEKNTKNESWTRMRIAFHFVHTTICCRFDWIVYMYWIPCDLINQNVLLAIDFHFVFARFPIESLSIPSSFPFNLIRFIIRMLFPTWQYVKRSKHLSFRRLIFFILDLLDVLAKIRIKANHPVFACWLSNVCSNWK